MSFPKSHTKSGPEASRAFRITSKTMCLFVCLFCFPFFMFYVFNRDPSDLAHTNRESSVENPQRLAVVTWGWK